MRHQTGRKAPANGILTSNYGQTGASRNGRSGDTREVSTASLRGVTCQHFEIASFVMDTRLAKAWAERGANYVIHRELHFSAHMELHEVFDDLALNLGWQAHRVDATSL